MTLWRPGTLRFHTFNNRMLLYDEGRTLIVRRLLAVDPGIATDGARRPINT